MLIRCSLPIPTKRLTPNSACLAGGGETWRLGAPMRKKSVQPFFMACCRGFPFAPNRYRPMRCAGTYAAHTLSGRAQRRRQRRAHQSRGRGAKHAFPTPMPPWECLAPGKLLPSMAASTSKGPRRALGVRLRPGRVQQETAPQVQTTSRRTMPGWLVPLDPHDRDGTFAYIAAAGGCATSRSYGWASSSVSDAVGGSSGVTGDPLSRRATCKC